MLGRKTYTQEELDHARVAMEEQLAAYRRLAGAVDASADAEAQAALAELEPVLFNNVALALDRYFVHRVRMVTGKDGNAINELELIADSLMDGGALKTNNVIKYIAAESVLKLAPGERIALSAEQFEAMATAFLQQVRAKFLEG